MRRYELMLLLRPDLEDDKLQAAVEKVTRAIVNAGGSLSKVSPWGKRRLAYDIGHASRGELLPDPLRYRALAGARDRARLLISEEILRHLVTVLEDRGPADEVAPAVAARGTDDRGEPDAAISARAEDGCPSVLAAAAPPAAERALPSEPVAEVAPEAEAAVETGRPRDRASRRRRGQPGRKERAAG